MDQAKNKGAALGISATTETEASCVMLDARRGSMPLNDLLAAPSETRDKAIEQDRLWVVNAFIDPKGGLFGTKEKTFCTIQPFSSLRYSAVMRAAFVEMQPVQAKALDQFEVIGSRAEVRHAIAPMFDSDEVVLIWLPKDLSNESAQTNLPKRI